MADKIVRDVLVAASVVTALVPAERITPLVRPQSITTPAITLQRISLVPQNHLRGDGDLDSNVVQLDVWAESYVSARAIADACRTALQTAGHVLTFENDDYEAETAPELYRVIQSWQVWTN